MAHVEVVPSPVSTIGEGPHWDVKSQSLYYVDIYGNESSLLRYDYNENKTYTATIDREPVVSFILPVENTVDQFAVGLGRRVGIVQWNGKSSKATLLRVAVEVESDPSFKTNRFNDAKADPTGRFYGGTMRLEECGDLFEAPVGALYRYSSAGNIDKLIENVRVSNGLAWNEKLKKFYYIDTCELNVREFDWDPETGDISRNNDCH